MSTGRRCGSKTNKKKEGRRGACPLLRLRIQLQQRLLGGAGGKEQQLGGEAQRPREQKGLQPVQEPDRSAGEAGPVTVTMPSGVRMAATVAEGSAKKPTAR